MSDKGDKLCYEDAKEKWNAFFSEDLFNSLMNNCSSLEQIIMRAAIRAAGEASEAVCNERVGQRDTRDEDECTTLIDSTLFTVASPRTQTEGVEIAQYLDEASLVTPRVSRFARPAPGLGEESP